MNRKEMTRAAVGVLLGAAGCSPAIQSLAVPAAKAEDIAPMTTVGDSVQLAPHVTEVRLSLISDAHGKDIGAAQFHLSPHSGWSIVSDDSRLHVSIEDGHVATVQASEDKEEQFVAVATLSHPNAPDFLVRCYVEPGG